MIGKCIISLMLSGVVFGAFADDAVGVFRVDVTNDAAAIALPFVPFGSGGLNSTVPYNNHGPNIYDDDIMR